jgi:anthraniloyl-CoA monooxygenase
MNIAIIGGGPAGLYCALLIKRANSAHRVRVIERNGAGQTFGWGVVLSDQTVDKLREADPASASAIEGAFHRWDDIDIFFKGERVTSGGHGFCGIGRQRLLGILQQRCQELGVELVFNAEAQDDALAADLIIAADGVNSRTRARHAATYQPRIEARHCRYVWLGTRKRFDAFTFAFRQTAHGWFQAHIYQYDGDTSTFIVETPEEVWRACGLDAMSRQECVAFCERLFADQLDGHALESHAPQREGAPLWARFARVVCAEWVHWQGDMPVVLMGDAAHTAHYSIGSGTRLALEDAIELAHQIHGLSDGGELAQALRSYQAARSVEVLKLQSAARNSMEWFENVARYSAFEAPQFAYALLTRSQRISHENLRLRDPAYVARFEAWLAQRSCAQAGVALAPGVQAPPMLTPFRVRGLTLKNRIVV